MLAGAAAGAAVRLVLGAQQVVQDVNDRGDIPLRLTVGVLKPFNQIKKNTKKDESYLSYDKKK